MCNQGPQSPQDLLDHVQDVLSGVFDYHDDQAGGGGGAAPPAAAAHAAHSSGGASGVSTIAEQYQTLTESTDPKAQGDALKALTDSFTQQRVDVDTQMG